VHRRRAPGVPCVQLAHPPRARLAPRAAARQTAEAVRGLCFSTTPFAPLESWCVARVVTISAALGDALQGF